MTKSSTARKIEVDEVESSHHWWETPLELFGLKEKTANDESISEARESLREAPKSRVSAEVVDYSLVTREARADLFALKKTAEEMGVDINKEGWEGELADRLEKAKEKVSGLPGKDEKEKKKAQKLFDEAIKEYGDKKMKKGFRAKKFSLKESMGKSWEKTKDTFFLFRPFAFLKSMFVDYFKWKSIKRYESEIDAYVRTKQKGKDIMAESEEARAAAKEGYKNYKTGKDTVAVNPAGMELIKGIKDKYKSKMHETTGLLLRKKITPRQAAEQVKKITTETANEGMKNGKVEFMKQVKENKFPGLKVKRIGKFMGIEIMTRGIIEGIEQRSFGAFTETITDSETWKEAVPIWGSIRSVDRLFIENGEPMWAKIADAGLNVVGDIYMIGTTVGTLGIGTGVAAAGRVGIVAAGKGVIKKLMTKEGVKQTAKGSARAAKGGVVSAGKWGAAALTLGFALDKVFPEGKIEQVASDIAVGSLTPGQKKLLEVTDVRIK